MSMPKYYMFRRPILDSLADGEEHSLKDIARPVAIKLHLTEKEMSEIVSGGEKRYITRIGWGRTALLKAGLIEKTAIGVYKITLTGQKVLADNPPVLDEEYLCKFEGYRKYQYPTKEEQEKQETLKKASTVPEAQIFRKAFLEALADGTEHNKQEVFSAIVSSLGISEQGLRETTTKGDRLRVPVRITWARRALKYAGLIAYPHTDVYKISAKGKAVLKNCPDVLSNEYLDGLKDNVELEEQTKAEVQKQIAENLQNGASKVSIQKIESKYTVTSYQVEAILNYIKSGDIAIPEIQRPFVWKATQVRDLIDSLYNCYPTGYFIIWQNPNVRLKNGESAVGKKVLIDGQQRVTAMMAALTGKSVLTDDYKEKSIKIAFNPVATDESERFAVQTAANIKDPKWISDISEVFATGFSTMTFILDYKQKNPEVNVLEVEQALKNLDAIKKCMLGVIVLDQGLSINEVTDIFVRINSTGKSLNASDFAMSKIAADEKHGGIMLRKAIDYFCRLMVNPAFYGQISKNDSEFMNSSFESKLRWAKDNTDDLYDPDYGDMLRVSFMHIFDRGKLSDLVSLLSGRDFEQRDFKESIAEESFKKLTLGIEDFMNQYNFQQFTIAITTAGFIDKKLLNSKMTIDFAYTLYLLLQKDKNIDRTMIKRYVQKWFVFTTLLGRYTSSPESKMDSDLRSIASKGFKTFLEENEAAELSDTFWNIQLVNELEKQSPNSPYYNVVIAAQIFNGEKALLSSGTTVNRLVRVMGDVHHIFPKDYLRKHGIDDKARYNQVANYTYLDTPVNVAVSNNPPKVYFNAALSDCGKPNNEQKVGPFVTTDEFYKNLETNCIPRDILEMDFNDYDKFLLERRKLMAKKIREYYEKL